MPDHREQIDRLNAALPGRYRVRRELGRGGMAIVYLADDLRHERQVAVKVLRPELAAAVGAERFLREIKLTARLDHPHILPLLDSGHAGGLLYYVMPYVEGESLRDALKRETQLPLEDALRITREVADGLGHAHALGIVHRDIKPENVLLSSGHARIGDFGIARAVTTVADRALTDTGLSIGTPAYMSPEQAGGARDVDARADVYSLGCMLFEMLTGEPPYTGASPMAILARKSSEERPPSARILRPTVPPEVEAAVQTSLARVPSDRYQTAREFVEALDLPPGPTPRDPRLQLPTRTLLIGAALVLSILAGWWGVNRTGPAPLTPRALAVLPFVNLSGTVEYDFFAHGMTDELIHRLAAVGVSVRSRTSVMRYRDSHEPTPAIADALGVDALVEGSVSLAADSAQIRVRLIQAQPESTLWVGTYDRHLRDVSALQSDVVRAIAEEIGATVTLQHAERLARAETVGPAAAQAYRRGRFYWNRRTAEDLIEAIGHFERATRIDPDYARAYAAMADAYTLLAYSSMVAMRPTEALPLARAAAERALQLEPDLAQAHTALASVDLYEWNWDTAQQGFERALELDPEDGMTHFRYANLLAAMGQVDQAVDRARQGHAVDPASSIISAGVAFALHFARRHEAAAEQGREVLELEPGFAIGHLRLGVALGWLGRYDEAIRELTNGLEVSGGNPGYQASLVRTFASAGRYDEARAGLDDLLHRAEEQYVPAYSIAVVYAALGEFDHAFDWLEHAYRERSADLAHIQVEPELDVLRDDTRFESLQRRVAASQAR